MKKFLTLTHFLFPVFIGVLVGGIILNNHAAIGWGLILIISDICIGIILQSFVEKDKSEYNQNNPLINKNISIPNTNPPNRSKIISVYDEDDEYKYKEDATNSDRTPQKTLGESFCDIASTLQRGGGARKVSNIYRDEACVFLCIFLSRMRIFIPRESLRNIYLVSAEMFDGRPTIIYTFRYLQGSPAENVFIFLVMTDEETIRCFTVETSFPFALCEYCENFHINHGQVELKDIPNRISEILNREELSI